VTSGSGSASPRAASPAPVDLTLPTTIYVVLVRGDFNEASGNPMGWAVAVGQARADLASTAMESRPEVPGNTWTALDLPSPQANP
jgi:hypothetical protein